MGYHECGHTIYLYPATLISNLWIIALEFSKITQISLVHPIKSEKNSPQKCLKSVICGRLVHLFLIVFLGFIWCCRKYKDVDLINHYMDGITDIFIMFFVDRWTFFPQKDTPLLYPEYSHAWSSDPVFEANIQSPDLTQHPLLACTSPMQCTLQPGTEKIIWVQNVIFTRILLDKIYMATHSPSWHLVLHNGAIGWLAKLATVAWSWSFNQYKKCFFHLQIMYSFHQIIVQVEANPTVHLVCLPFILNYFVSV